MLKRAAISVAGMLSTAYFVGLGKNRGDFTFAGVGQ
jgi:hypothetical protein